MTWAQQIIGLHQGVTLIIQVTNQLIELPSGKGSQLYPHRRIGKSPAGRQRAVGPARNRTRRQRGEHPTSVENLIEPPGRLRRWPLLATTQLRNMPRVTRNPSTEFPDT